MSTITINIDGIERARIEPQPADPWLEYVAPERIRDDQRAALFAAFGNVFGTQDPRARAVFTRVVLEKGPHDCVSWSRHGGMTAQEAHVMLNALDAYERVESLYG